MEIWEREAARWVNLTPHWLYRFIRAAVRSLVFAH